MLHRIAILILAAGVAVGNNLHLPILQVAAWAGMVAAYSQDHDLSTAVEQTFGGDRPCSLCTAIKDQQMETASNELQPVTPPPLIWFNDCPPPWQPILLAAGPSPAESTFCINRTLTPEPPPPRCIVA